MVASSAMMGTFPALSRTRIRGVAPHTKKLFVLGERRRAVDMATANPGPESMAQRDVAERGCLGYSCNCRTGRAQRVWDMTGVAGCRRQREVDSRGVSRAPQNGTAVASVLVDIPCSRSYVGLVAMVEMQDGEVSQGEKERRQRW